MENFFNQVIVLLPVNVKLNISFAFLQSLSKNGIRRNN